MDEQSGDAPAPTVWHCFRCSDSRTGIAWLVAALGFVETACYSEDGVVTHAQYNVKATGHVARIRRDLGIE